mmetsp:Transcript_13850/g.18192  ORF Transcript_13850/g.18192 Transcript_13850/m.18192 type:complete len:95 (-) Transcript_13850:120-404(-)
MLENIRHRSLKFCGKKSMKQEDLIFNKLKKLSKKVTRGVRPSLDGTVSLTISPQCFRASNALAGLAQSFPSDLDLRTMFQRFLVSDCLWPKEKE